MADYYYAKKRRIANRKFFRTKIDTSQIAQAEGRTHNQKFLNELNALIGSTGIWGREASPKQFIQILWIVAPKFMAQTAFETLAITGGENSQELISDLAYAPTEEEKERRRNRPRLPVVLYDSVPKKCRLEPMRDSRHGDRRCSCATRLWRNSSRPIVDERKKFDSKERYNLFMVYDRCTGISVLSDENGRCCSHGVMGIRDWKEEFEWLTDKYTVWMEWKKQGRIF